MMIDSLKQLCGDAQQVATLIAQLLNPKASPATSYEHEADLLLSSAREHQEDSEDSINNDHAQRTALGTRHQRDTVKRPISLQSTATPVATDRPHRTSSAPTHSTSASTSPSPSPGAASPSLNKSPSFLHRGSSLSTSPASEPSHLRPIFTQALPLSPIPSLPSSLSSSPAATPSNNPSSSPLHPASQTTPQGSLSASPKSPAVAHRSKSPAVVGDLKGEEEEEETSTKDQPSLPKEKHNGEMKKKEHNVDDDDDDQYNPMLYYFLYENANAPQHHHQSRDSAVSSSSSSSNSPSLVPSTQVDLNADWSNLDHLLG